MTIDSSNIVSRQMQQRTIEDYTGENDKFDLAVIPDFDSKAISAFVVPTALVDAFRIFTLAHMYDNEEVTFLLDNVKQGEIFWEAFNIIFDLPLKKEPKLIRNTVWYGDFGDRRHEVCYDMGIRIGPTRQEKEQIVDHMSGKFRPGFKTTDNDYFVYSIHHMSKNHKGVDQFFLDKMIEMFINSGGIDLGNSRDFNTTDELVDKMKLLANASCYIGTKTSWINLSRFFSVPGMALYQHSPHRSKW